MLLLILCFILTDFLQNKLGLQINRKDETYCSVELPDIQPLLHVDDIVEARSVDNIIDARTGLCLLDKSFHYTICPHIVLVTDSSVFFSGRPPRYGITVVYTLASRSFLVLFGCVSCSLALFNAFLRIHSM